MDNITNYKELLKLKNFSESTVRGYMSTILIVSKRLNIPIDKIKENDLRIYILSNKMSSSSQMGVINAFKSYYNLIEHRKFNKDILPRPKVSQKQPDILSIDEMQKIIDNISNIKHKAIICLMYSCALRVSEVINLKIKDLDPKNNRINLKDSKGKIDRIVMLDQSILELLRKYWMLYKTKKYVFEGSKGDRYSKSSIQRIIKVTVKKLNINKNISTHSLRHSCLTQLIKNGVDLRRVQKIAGHKNINTTANYIKMIDEDILNTDSPIKLINL